MMKSWLIVSVVAIFMGIKEASAQTILTPATELKTVQLSNPKFDQVITCNFGHDGEAHFPGGETALYKYITQYFHPPKGIKGKIVSIFIVEKDGSLTDISILKGVSADADTAALKVIRNMPKWIPDIEAGKARQARYVLPFNLNKKN